MASPNTIVRREWERELESLTVGKFVPFKLSPERKKKNTYIAQTKLSGNHYRHYLKKMKRLAKIKLDELKTIDLTSA